MERSLYALQLFKFIVGGNTFYIHADAVSRYSKPVDRTEVDTESLVTR